MGAEEEQQVDVPAWLTRGVLGLAIAAGAVGVGLDLAGVRSLARVVLVLLFLAVAPTAAIAGLLRTSDRFARALIAATANVCLIALIAIIMLAEGLWSPTGGLLAVTGITAACLLAQVPQVRRRIKMTSWRPSRALGRSARLISLGKSRKVPG
ncbi:MAG TPA: hypothetical protein VGH27_01895 [Streptosporangiaceae bacterium]